MRKILVLSLLCLVASAAMAQHTLNQLFIRVQLRQDGSARVSETRKVSVTDKGTEGYIAMYNMGDIEVCDLKVYDDKKIEYALEEDWDVDLSRAEKKNLCGYNRTRQGLELCWGLGDSGERTYVICYTLKNLVKAYEDYDGFNHSFYEAAASPAKEALVSIQLEEEDDSLTRDNAAIWTFGYHGYKGFAKGHCYAYAKKPMKEGESIIVLLQLEKGVLNPAVKKKKSFTEAVKRVAFEGSDYDLDDAGLGDSVSVRKGSAPRSAAVAEDGDDDDDDGGMGLFGWFLVILGGGFVLFKVLGFIWLVIEGLYFRHVKKNYLKGQLNGLMEGCTYDDMPYYRDLPLDGNLLLSGAVLGSVDGMARYCGRKKLGMKYGLQQLYDAFILRMIYKQHVQLVYDKDEKGNPRKLFRIEEPVKPKKGTDLTKILEQDFLKKSELKGNSAIDESTMLSAKAGLSGYINDAGVEYFLQKLLYDAAGEDHLLQPNELKQYVEKKAENCRPFAIVLGMLTEETIKEEHLHKDEVWQTVGFFRYLRDFSLVAERNIEETALWKEYLVHASLYGIADQVRKDMKKVAPDAARLDELIPPESLVSDFRPLATAIADSVVTVYAYKTVSEKAKIYAEDLRRSRWSSSSGGSGSSSYGGGGGHSGGGGSGFR